MPLMSCPRLIQAVPLNAPQLPLFGDQRYSGPKDGNQPQPCCLCSLTLFGSHVPSPLCPGIIGKFQRVYCHVTSAEPTCIYPAWTTGVRRRAVTYAACVVSPTLSAWKPSRCIHSVLPLLSGTDAYHYRPTSLPGDSRWVLALPH